MKSTLIIFLLFLTFSCSTNIINEREIINKNVDVKNVKKKIQELNKKKIDYLVLKKEFTYFGYLEKANRGEKCNDCVSNTFYYIIWKDQGKSKIQKIDQCGIFFPQNLLDASIVDYFENNFDEIQKGKVKFYQVDESHISLANHTELNGIIIKKEREFSFNSFDVLSLTTEDKKPNINFDYNNNLKLIILDNFLKKEIEINDSLNTFKRDFSTCEKGIKKF